MEILHRYSEQGLKMPDAKFKPPTKEITVELSVEIADRLDPIAKRIGEQFELYGIRAKINFRCLLKCLAYRNGRKNVIEADFKEFLALADFMNFKYNPLGCGVP